MSCSSLRHKFEEQRQRGLSFRQAMDFYHDVRGSIDAHKAELDELQRMGKNTEEIAHLKSHIAEGEQLIREIESLHLH